MITQNETVPTRMLSGSFGERRVIDLQAAAGERLAKMPWCHRILLENVLRQPPEVGKAACAALLDWTDQGRGEAEIPFAPTRILMHDTTCGPALVDIAAMRDVLAEAGFDPAVLNPLVPVATSTDHSLAVDVSGVPDAFQTNMRREIARNAERYRFVKWAAGTIEGFRAFPPGTGIMHTINMERLATVVTSATQDDGRWAWPDTLVGTDSHTPMVNALGVLGWGVGGIEAEGVMFGVPISLRIPDVIGVRLTGHLRPGVLATDLALLVTQKLRALKVAGEFVEFFGPGLAGLAAGERAVVANMAPEYGASTGFFPIDQQVLTFLADTGRTAQQIALVEAYARANALWHGDDSPAPTYTHLLEIDLNALKTSVAGPRRPQDRLEPAQVPTLVAGRPASGTDIPADALAIAALTSCTNTTDFGLLATAGLLARKARQRGLKPPAWVKTSMTPGSPSAAERLGRACVLDDLEALGFGVAGYGCATCIGNSGPLLPAMDAAVDAGLAPFAVLSGNRNFPGRVHARVDDALLASPPLVIAYALAGRVGLDITTEPLGVDQAGAPITLAELWPSVEAIETAKRAGTDPAWVVEAYDRAEASADWRELAAPSGERFPWDPASTYLRRPPFVDFAPARPAGAAVLTAHPLLVLGDDITTDHISPAGAIPPKSDAGVWLTERGENPRDLNVYASRRGNWEVMLRGLFTNRTLKNALGRDIPPGHTLLPGGDGTPITVWRAARANVAAGRHQLIVAGERYGTGSSRDWAAKGVKLLGVEAVLARSFERIHRANLVCMGILPIILPEDWQPQAMGLGPDDQIDLAWDPAAWSPRGAIDVTIRSHDGRTLTARAALALDTPREADLVRAGGIIPMILRRAAGQTARH